MKRVGKLLVVVVVATALVAGSVGYVIVSRRDARPIFRNKFVRADTVLPVWVFGTWPGTDNLGNFVLIDEALNQVAVIETGDQAYPIDRVESNTTQAVFPLKAGLRITIQRQPNSIVVALADGTTKSASVGEGAAKSLFEELRLYGYNGGNLIDRALERTASSRPTTAE